MITDVDTALIEIADWYIKNRRNITEPELESILMKHCGTEAEVRKFVKFLETEPGQLRFKTHLRERKGVMPSPSLRQQIPLNWYEIIRQEPRDGQPGYLVWNYYPSGWPQHPTIEKDESWIAKYTYQDWQKRAAPWTFETWKVAIWKEAGKPLEKPSYLKQPTGTCYQDAWRFLLKEEEGELVHGSVENGRGKRINHAWVETETGYVWEPESRQFFALDSFKSGFQAKEDARYTVEQAAIMAARTGKHGPWTEAERKQFLSPSPSYLKVAETECQLISPQYYDILTWLNVPVPGYSFAIEPEVKERKIDEVLQKLKDGVSRIHESAIFREFLITMAKFHDYSIGNQILIMIQRPTATRVAGFHTWKDLGRYVKAGERGIAILAPCLPPKELRCPICGQSFTEKELRTHLLEVHQRKDISELVREAREAVIVPTPTYFKVVYVFDVSQTEGKALPEIAVPVLTGVFSQELYDQLMKLASKHSLTVSLEPKPGVDPEIKGMLVGKSIWIRPEEAPAQRLKTLAHEEAHYFTEQVYFIPRAEAEVIAESVAFVVCAHFGFDTGIRSFPYVAIWAKEKKVLEQNLASIREISGRMIGELA